MIQHSCITGHGDTVDALLVELGEQIDRYRRNYMERTREREALQAEIDRLRLENERLAQRVREAEEAAKRAGWDLDTSTADFLGTNERLTRERDALSLLLNTPEVDDFDRAIPLEAAHQVQRWGVKHDSGKEPADWFWLVGYLAGKALTAHLLGNIDKAKHHTISTAAALRNWHAHIRSGNTLMRPGIEEPIPPSTTQEPQ